MRDDDLISYLQPAPTQLDPHAWRDVTGRIAHLRVEPQRFALRVALPAGLYRARLETQPGAFDMRTAMLEMVRVPDGKRVPVGPWDFDHTRGVMALPMARVWVNQKLKGGLWFDVPGPEQIAEGRLAADFGFEAGGEETELVMEFIERDRERLEWGRLRSMEIRRDDRLPRPLPPRSNQRPRIYLSAVELPALRKRLAADTEFQSLLARLAAGETLTGVESSAEIDLTCLAFLVTGDKRIAARVMEHVLELCRRPTWSAKADPLVMGGDNDRNVGYKLYETGLVWDWLGDLFTDEERRVVLAKAEEYLTKLYDFTVLQRAYMGCPSADAHTLGAWSGVGIAAMAFHDELPIARKALPFFHGLFVDSLQMFPADGKTVWATFYPFHLVRYLAAAHTFGGQRPELSESAYLDHLGEALLASFETANSQELQRGLRTYEHRYLTAFLCRFHSPARSAAIYQAFVERERAQAGDVARGLFDLL
jgi:hypothetical protein